MPDATGATKPLEVFYAYAREDEKLRKKLNKSISILIADGVIAPWYDRDVSAGLEWEHVIDEHLNRANIILLLISLDFIGSPYCYGIEMKR
ncbi:MAG TPA: TIR domain-containing protein, partial [Chloroflexia bacterium]|nr:TIR domain-containing protein [Chloroflexia bacterium]